MAVQSDSRLRAVGDASLAPSRKGGQVATAAVADTNSSTDSGGGGVVPTGSREDEIKRAEIEARARAISRNVRCLTCANQSIEDSQSDIAALLRRLIREELRQGKSEQEVYGKLTQEFGETVLYKPPFDAQTALLWLLPAVCMAGAAGISWIARRRASRRLFAAHNLFPNLPLTATEREALAKLIEPPSFAPRRRGWSPF